MEDWANILLLSGEGGLGAVQGEGRVEQLDRAARQLADLADLPTTESDLLQLARAAQIIAKHLLQQQVIHFPKNLFLPYIWNIFLRCILRQNT